MRMLIVQCKHIATKNLMHNVDQSVNSHTENFMRSKMHCSLEEVGTTKQGDWWTKPVVAQEYSVICRWTIKCQA